MDKTKYVQLVNLFPIEINVEYPACIASQLKNGQVFYIKKYFKLSLGVFLSFKKTCYKLHRDHRAFHGF
jgi:hypothetical protein